MIPRWAVALCLLFLAQGGLMAAPMTQGEYDRLASRLQAENEEIAQRMARNQTEINRLNMAINPLNEQVSSSLFLGPGNLLGSENGLGSVNRLLGLGSQNSDADTKREEIYRQIDALEKQRNPLLTENNALRARAESNDRMLAEAGEALEKAKQAQAEKDRAEAEAKRIADAKAAEERRQAEERAEVRRVAAEKAAEERRVAYEEAREKRQWTLLYLVGGSFILLFGMFFALRAFGANVSLSEWSRSFYWVVRACVVVTFALFFLTAVETIFGAVSFPDWMRRPLADLLDRASDAVAPPPQEAVK